MDTGHISKIQLLHSKQHVRDSGHVTGARTHLTRRLAVYTLISISLSRTRSWLVARPIKLEFEKWYYRQDASKHEWMHFVSTDHPRTYFAQPPCSQYPLRRTSVPHRVGLVISLHCSLSSQSLRIDLQGFLLDCQGPRPKWTYLQTLHMSCAMRLETR